MEYQVNTVIIGGGPAGVACGLALQNKALSNLIVEKRAFPREKLCGGLITEKTFLKITELWQMAAPGEELPPGLFCDESREVEFRYAGDRLTRSDLSKPFRLVRRRDFDSALASLYRKTGGTLLENCTAVEWNVPGGMVRLSNGDTVLFERLVAADGALSKTRELLGVPAPALGFCMETYVPRPNGEWPLVIDFGAVKNGYGWIFPSGAELCVGLISACRRGIDLKAAFRAFLKENGFPAEESAFRGAFVPYGKAPDQSGCAANAVLIGDAGGFADPIYGEGLYFALSTGLAAAEAAVRSTRNGEPFKTAFLRETAEFAEIIRQGSALQKKFFSPAIRAAFRKKLKGKNAFAAFYCEHQVAAYDYSYAELGKLARDYKKTKGE